MPVEHEARTVREAVGVFNRPESFSMQSTSCSALGFIAPN